MTGTGRKGNGMSNKVESMNIEQLLAEADELILEINSGVIENMKEEQRLHVEKHAESLKKIKSEMQNKIEKKGKSEILSYGEGTHEAFQDITKAIRSLKKYLS